MCVVYDVLELFLLPLKGLGEESRKTEMGEKERRFWCLGERASR